jgi:hypothetical protein
MKAPIFADIFSWCLREVDVAMRWIADTEVDDGS